MNTEEKTLHLLIHGKVQGVYFRASARQKAQALGLNGWVRNLADGRVELLAQGPEAALQALLTWAWQGPSAARVDHLDADWSKRADCQPGFTLAPDGP